VSSGAILRGRGWTCATCGVLITGIEDGWVEWLATEQDGITGLKGLRLVHQLASRGRGCKYDARREFRNDGSIVEGLPLERFVSSDGLMMLLWFLATGELPKDDVLELAGECKFPDLS
jgi:hypothetical protein